MVIMNILQHYDDLHSAFMLTRPYLMEWLHAPEDEEAQKIQRDNCDHYATFRARAFMLAGPHLKMKKHNR